MEINLNNVYDSMIIDPVMGLIRDKVGRSSQDNAKFGPLSLSQISSERMMVWRERRRTKNEDICL